MVPGALCFLTAIQAIFADFFKTDAVNRLVLILITFHLLVTFDRSFLFFVLSRYLVTPPRVAFALWECLVGSAADLALITRYLD